MRTPRGLIGPLVLVLGIAALWAAARRWLDTVEVHGRSMAPSLLAGDRLLVARLPPRVGSVVLAPDPREPSRELIKRIASVDGLGVSLRGDNPIASTDARAFGALPPSRVRWRAVLRYWPLDRFGPIPSAPPVVAFERLDEGGEPACTCPEALIAGE